MKDKSFARRSTQNKPNKTAVDQSIVVGLDIGTTKIACFVGIKNDHGKIEIISKGKSKSIGVKQGVVFNIGETIESIEKDSNNPLDVLFFLPAGDMGDLILRTKMRTLATHFSGDNFPNIGSFKTSQALNVYCAYDSSLNSNKKFIESFDSNFPQKISQEIIHSEMITVLKITLNPCSSIEQPS